MDPLSQGLVGTAAAQLTGTKRQQFKAAGIGFLAGLAADLDVVIRSSTDPLLALEYHRQFTHSLFFIPFAAALLTYVLWLIAKFRKKPQKNSNEFKRASVFIFALAGYATHALLDACTTYGTQLLWPISNTRVAWNIVSVVDPMFTLPLLGLLSVSLIRRSRAWGVVSLVYALAYLSLGWVQNQRATELASQLAESRQHEPQRLGVKPSFANIEVWKSVYEYEGRYYVDAIRVLKENDIYEGTSTEKLVVDEQFPWLDDDSQQAKDVERFRWFSNDYLGIDPDNPSRIIDIRYSLIPNRLDGMWGIVLDPNASQDAHVAFTTSRPSTNDIGEEVSVLWSMITGSYNANAD